MRYFYALLITLYNLTILSGTVYLIEHYHWNPWWFLITILFLMTIDVSERR